MTVIEGIFLICIGFGAGIFARKHELPRYFMEYLGLSKKKEPQEPETKPGGNRSSTKNATK